MRIGRAVTQSSLLGTLALAAVACTGSSDTITALKTEGPPEILQVFVTARVDNRTSLVLAQGFHPDISVDTSDPEDGEADMTPKVESAVVGPNQRIRVIFDELLEGDTVEHFDCFCALGCGADESDPTVCCPNGTLASLRPQDCDDDPDTSFNEQGQFLDQNFDGVPDRIRLLPDVFRVNCDGVDVYVSGVKDGFYTPSGNQILPNDGEDFVVEGLGPAVEFNTTAGLKTNAECKVAFAATVTDQQGEAIPTLATDTRWADTFHTENLRLVSSVPANNAMNVVVTQVITLSFNAAMDPTSFNDITVREMGGADIAVTFAPAPNGSAVNITPDAPLDSATVYEIVIPTSVTDKFGGAFPAEQVITFRTAI